MNRTLAKLTTALLLALALAACTDPISFPAVSVQQVGAVNAQGTFTVSGSNFFKYADGEGMSVEVCGVTIDATIVDPTTAEILLPPAGVVKVQTGERLTVTLPAGLEGGSGDVRIIRPDGQVTVIEDAITCPTPTPDPTPDPEPDPEPDPDPEPEIVPAIAVLTANVTEGEAPLNVTFSASGSSAYGDYRLDWDFDDGNTTNALNIQHTFTDPGEYDVTLTVKGENGQTDTATQRITVTAPSNRAPTARITYTVTDNINYTGGAMIFIDGTGSTDPDGDDLTYAWKELNMFGDAIISTEPTIEGPQGFNLPARFVLTVTDSHGASDTAYLSGLLDAPESLLYAEGEPDPYATDITLASWTTDDEGVTRLRLEGVNDLVLPAFNTTPFCGLPVGLDASFSPLEGPAFGTLTGTIGLDTDRNVNTGVSYAPNLPGADYLILLDTRSADGSFPIVWAEEYGGPCSYYHDFISGWATAEVEDGVATFTFTTPENRGSDFDFTAEVGAIGSYFTDTVPDASAY